MAVCAALDEQTMVRAVESAATQFRHGNSNRIKREIVVVEAEERRLVAAIKNGSDLSRRLRR